MAKRRWKPREVRRALIRLGFTEKLSRGKGDHRMYFKTVHCAEGEIVTLVTVLDMGGDIVSLKSLQAILDAISLDIETLERVFRGNYSVQKYEAYLRTRKKAELLPKPLRQSSR